MPTRAGLAAAGDVQGAAAVGLYDLSDVNWPRRFRRFCGLSGSEFVPERTAFVRFRKALVAAGLDRSLFEVTLQLKAKAWGEDRHDH